MKTLVILSALLALLSLKGFSKDKLHFKSGKVEEVKVLEIGEQSVRYKMFDNQSGPEYVVEKTKIEKIVYQNGNIERFVSVSDNKPGREEKTRKEFKDYGHHFVGVNLSDLFRTDLCFHYEFFFLRGQLGLRVPMLVGFNNQYFNLNSTINNPYIFKRNRVFETGLDFRYYPGGQGHVRYVFGPAFHYLINNKRGFVSNGTVTGSHHVNSLRWFIYNGVVFSPIKNFRFGLDVGLGSQYDLTETDYSTKAGGDFKLQINWYMGAKF